MKKRKRIRKEENMQNAEIQKTLKFYYGIRQEEKDNDLFDYYV